MYVKKIENTLANVSPKDVRSRTLLILVFYLLLGIVYLGFNRSFSQVIIISLTAMCCEVVLELIYNKKIKFPLSSLIASISLSLLLDFPHGSNLIVFPALLAVSSKYIFTYKKHHIFNPSLFGILSSLYFFGDYIGLAPSFQWNAMPEVALLIVLMALLFVLPKTKRLPLVASFLLSFLLLTFFRGIYLQSIIPFKILVWGTFFSPAFVLFAFFMISDPKTSPSDKKEQIYVGVLIASFDFIFHLFSSYYTFFYAALLVSLLRVIYLAIKDGFFSKELRIESFKNLIIFCIRIVPVAVVLIIIQLLLKSDFKINDNDINFSLNKIDITRSGMDVELGAVLDEVDPKVRHIAKYVLSLNDAVAIGDYDNDGELDLFFTNTLKKDEQRNSMFRGLGEFKFKKVNFPEIKAVTLDFKKYGIPSTALFVDYDNDGDQDLFVSYMFGSSRMFKNFLVEKGSPDFKDFTEEIGLYHYSNSSSAIFFDINQDGLLDLVQINFYKAELEGYDQYTPLNMFSLPKESFPGDRRPYNIMHANWHMSENGGINEIYLQNLENKFIKQDTELWGLINRRWSLDIGVSDLNQDGWPDLYIANDYGKDELYYNNKGRSFTSIKGPFFGNIGKDTYKGMNVTMTDFDQNGFFDIYVSNVHHPFLSEGSLLWSFKKAGVKNSVFIEDVASKYNLVNEGRFGWGAAAVDLNNDGWVDIVQTNGMFGDSHDKNRHSNCIDYWYFTEKQSRAQDGWMKYVDNWTDARGACMYLEKSDNSDRVFLSDIKKGNQRSFSEVSNKIGFNHMSYTRGVAAADFNNDGRKDLLVTSIYESPILYENKLKNNVAKEDWIGFKLLSNVKWCNKSAIGSTIKLKQTFLDGSIKEELKEVRLKNGFNSQTDLKVVFGLGIMEEKIRIEIKAEINWCNKQKVDYHNLELNKYNELGLLYDEG